MFAFSPPGWLRCVRMHRSVRGVRSRLAASQALSPRRSSCCTSPRFVVSLFLFPLLSSHKATRNPQPTRHEGARHEAPGTREARAHIIQACPRGGGGPELLGLLAEDEGVSKRVEDRHLLGPLGRAVLEPRPHVAVALCCQRGVVLGKVGRGDAEPDARAAVAVVLAQV